ncbi:MAG: hypothetical protein ABIX44_02100, partial [Cryobacterium sp.]
MEKRIDRDTERIEHTSSVKDVQALETELAALRKRHTDLEEIELTVMERLEEREAAVAEVAATGDAIAAQVAEVEAAKAIRLTELNRELGELARDRETIAATLTDELRAL